MGSKKGWKMSDTGRRNISVGLTGKKFSEEHKRKLKQNHKGAKGKHWKLSDKAKQNISRGHLGLRLGELNPLWKGGITPITKQIRNCFEYRQWRSDVFTRDNFTCILCGRRGIYIEADHYPKRFSEIFFENKIKTFEEALNCEEFWNINNGRTLCLNCHNPTKGRRDKTR